MKEKVNLEIMHEDPKEILEGPRQDRKNSGMGENANATTARELRGRLARYRIVLENEEREPEAQQLSTTSTTERYKRKAYPDFSFPSERKEKRGSDKTGSYCHLRNWSS